MIQTIQKRSDISERHAPAADGFSTHAVASVRGPLARSVQYLGARASGP
ncbi:MAG: hypothetical protein J7465_13070 [Chloroflexus sp.]|nr:hypothetical protein [Chloroflexus sp.]MBO9372373.1 hypothetical protein [Chloroflexus sp.]